MQSECGMNLVGERLNDVYKLLREGHSTIISDVNDDLKCFICKNVLINASQSVCGCIFCERCINNYKREGGAFCPGDTDECKKDNLSNIVPDHRRNREISRLRVRCDEEGCDYECQLVDLETHLRDCRGKRLNCPFNNIGCEEDKLNFKKMNEHLQKECYNHNNILIELINNLRNEMRELRENEEKLKCEVIMLKEDQNKGIMLEKEVERLKMNLNGRTTEMREKEEKHKWEVIILKEDQKKVQDEIMIIKEEIERLKSNLNGRTETDKNEKEEILKEMRNTNVQIDKLNKCLDTRNTTFTWEIGIIDQLDWIQFSVPFYDRRNLYKMGLVLFDLSKVQMLSNENQFKKMYEDFATEIEDVEDAIVIDIVLYPGESDADLEWPFKANVKIQIVNSFSMTEPNSFTKECEIDRPDDCNSKSDLEFIFHKSKLFGSSRNTIPKIPFRVECSVEVIN